MDTDFTFWLVLSMLILLIITSITVLIRACIGDLCVGIFDRLFNFPIPGTGGISGGNSRDVEASVQAAPREPVVYVISPQLVMERRRSGRREQRELPPRWRESPPADGAYNGLCSTPPPAYEPPPAYHSLLHGSWRRRHKSLTGSVGSSLLEGLGGGGNTTATSSSTAPVSPEPPPSSPSSSPSPAVLPEVHVSVVVLEASAHWL
ncbi:hypothetical protein BV898_06766 [Hypsibius exemplaris]|uniref:Uncharacterized protein n=1 Tax=Hypsibius exemplaris TaxID=2072580 RepID=A0A1W0WVE1_HYPEX|nr:hypothetical protein BV898_06766 [Hypsibius exemplaris]